MKKYLLPFLVSGKLATMPVTTELSFASIREMPANTSVKSRTLVNSLEDISNIGVISGNGELRSNSAENKVPNLKMDLLIAGLNKGDEVIIGISKGKDDPRLLAVNPRLHLDLHKLTVLSHFTVIDIADINRPSFYDTKLSSLEPNKVVSVPIDFSNVDRQVIDEDSYLQAVVAPNSEWDWHKVRCSDIAQIKYQNKSVILLSKNATEDCTRFRCY